MRLLHHKSWMSGLLLVAVCATPAKAQQSQTSDTQNQQNQQDQQNQSAPIPAYRSPFASAVDNGDSQDEGQTAQPDTRPLTGAQYITLGGIATTRSYWQPRLDLFGSGDSNPLESPVNSNWGTWTSFEGGADIYRTSGRSNLTLNYTGGDIYSNDAAVPGGPVQELNFEDKISFRSVDISFLDEFSYIPELLFGVGGPAFPGAGTTALGPGFAPQQTILGGQGRTLTNSYVTEVDIHLDPRSSFTLAGGYSVLEFFNSDLLNSGTTTVQAGYNYQATTKNTLGVLYSFSGFQYTHFNQSMYSHTVEASYARRITGKLAFQIAAGPQLLWVQMPIFGGVGTPAGTGGGTPASPGPSNNLYWALNTAMQYQESRTVLGAAYSHGVTVGAGVLGGAIADTVGGSITHKMSRTFSSGITAGYSRNSGLPFGIGVPANQTYDYTFAGLNLTRPVGETLGLTFSYQMQYQTSNAPFCIGLACGVNVMRHLISVGLSWHQRPLVF